MDNKPIPKSLHTVRALAQMTRMAMQLDATLTADAAMYKVLVHLGYADTSDAYDLKTKAMKQL